MQLTLRRTGTGGAPDRQSRPRACPPGSRGGHLRLAGRRGPHPRRQCRRDDARRQPEQVARGAKVPGRRPKALVGPGPGALAREGGTVAGHSMDRRQGLMSGNVHVIRKARARWRPPAEAGPPGQNRRLAWRLCRQGRSPSMYHPTHVRAFWNIRSQGPSSPDHSGGA